MFSHWTEAFSSGQASAAAVAKILLGKIVPTREPLELPRGRRTLTGRVLQQACPSLPSPTPPSVPELVTHTTSTGEPQLAKSIHLPNNWAQSIAAGPSNPQIHPLGNCQTPTRGDFQDVQCSGPLPPLTQVNERTSTSILFFGSNFFS